MITIQRLAVIACLFIHCGCDQTPATIPQASAAVTQQVQPTVEAITPPTTPDAKPEASEITGKVVGIIDGDTFDILTPDGQVPRTIESLAGASGIPRQVNQPTAGLCLTSRRYLSTI